ncbi:MAG TPA: DUF6088 family protein [Candidatus Baltobacteraceae bacterium]|jgi:hypothetical protein|nr:DUF6088 family protein [Candidatus Baltobacteraceae bacterium]
MLRLSLRERIAKRIERAKENIFLPREFRDLGGEDQVLRGLRELVREKRLVRLGYGVYGKAFVSRLTGEPVLAGAGGFIAAARQTLDKLGIPWDITAAEKAYNEGRTTQVPANAVIRIKGRFRRKLALRNTELRIEH